MSGETKTVNYAGWWRLSKRHHWQQLAEGDDYGSTLNALLDAVADRPRGGELLACRHDPNPGANAPGVRPRRCF